jgi:antitoxin component of MazEF toxin-antitoxin module
MFTQNIRKSGNSYVITIPKEEFDQLGLQDGQPVYVHITPAETRPVLRPELREALDEVWSEIEPGLEYLRDR